LVPKEKNSATSAICPAVSAARGSSILCTWVLKRPVSRAIDPCAVVSRRLGAREHRLDSCPALPRGTARPGLKE